MTDYWIFARREYGQPLAWICTVRCGGDASSQELGQRAREQFGAEGWVEMVAIPWQAIVQVIPTEAERVSSRA